MRAGRAASERAVVAQGGTRQSETTTRATTTEAQCKPARSQRERCGRALRTHHSGNIFAHHCATLSPPTGDWFAACRQADCALQPQARPLITDDVGARI